MKTKHIVCIFSFFLSSCYCYFAKGQITLDTIVNPWNLIGYDFYPVHLSESETKYYEQDTLSNTFNLYNLDFSPYLLNVPVPEPFDPFHANMEVIYLSRTLFDCDSINIEFIYTSIGSGFHPLYIMRTDGTQLFKIDSAKAPYCFGCLNGSQDIKPIFNTEIGAKLFIYSPKNTNNLRIYSLCGHLPPNLYNLTTEIQNRNSIIIFPNPTTGNINIRILSPNNLFPKKLILYDSNLNEVIQKEIPSNVSDINLDEHHLSSGIYFYKLFSLGKEYESGKFIIN